jgi:hypothetical protein
VDSISRRGQHSDFRVLYIFSDMFAYFLGHAVVVQALCYKPEGHGFETR